MNDPPIDSSEKFTQALEESNHTKRILRLYIAGNSQKSAQAIANINEICETHFKGRYELEVIDIYQQPLLARSEQIIAVPTLIKLLPLPLRRMIGDFSRIEHTLAGLYLRPMESDPQNGDGHLKEPSEKEEAEDHG